MNEELKTIIHDMVKDVVNTVKEKGLDITYIDMAWCDEPECHYIMVNAMNNGKTIFNSHEVWDEE